MIKKVTLSKFWRLALGLLLVGVGQRLLLTGVLSPWATDTALSIVLPLMSLAFCAVGLFLVIPIGVWFYKLHRSDKRLPKLILAYLLTAVTVGFLIGGLGQLLYDHTSFSYSNVKTGIWVFSTIIQTDLKVILIYSLVKIDRALPIKEDWRQTTPPLLIATGCTMVALVLSLWLPTVGGVVVSVVDSLILMATLYYFIYRIH
ncbi:hypothetical protein [Streptococcus cuniculi]|uniref:Uncharacterized protein n=1 Tax=Streptococcus cuniculi TaxID=1432788 RepID=A0A4Y9J6X4_9STRE|nr:hypothetical protein [Streptococcus cuniculi]MBF0779385.1 hypothetical protein [Streptococcus cuniculi]TFU96587.1 hypothetical protein E4T82_11905 [Streptococcus cuniculi]